MSVSTGDSRLDVMLDLLQETGDHELAELLRDRAGVYELLLATSSHHEGVVSLYELQPRVGLSHRRMLAESDKRCVRAFEWSETGVVEQGHREAHEVTIGALHRPSCIVSRFLLAFGGAAERERSAEQAHLLVHWALTHGYLPKVPIAWAGETFVPVVPGFDTPQVRVGADDFSPARVREFFAVTIGSAPTALHPFDEPLGIESDP